MGIFSKIFGGNELELEDDTQKSAQSKKNQDIQNEEISPFLEDDVESVNDEVKDE